MEKIVHDSRVLAVVFSINEVSLSEMRTLMFTPEDWGLQVGLLSRPRGYAVRPHTHVRERPRGEACELLIVLRGRIRVSLLDQDGRVLRTLELADGQGIVMRCPHAVDILDDSVILEVKEGPYPGPERDKIWISVK